MSLFFYAFPSLFVDAILDCDTLIKAQHLVQYKSLYHYLLGNNVPYLGPFEHLLLVNLFSGMARTGVEKENLSLFLGRVSTAPQMSPGGEGRLCLTIFLTTWPSLRPSKCPLAFATLMLSQGDASLVLAWSIPLSFYLCAVLFSQQIVLLKVACPA